MPAVSALFGAALVHLCSLHTHRYILLQVTMNERTKRSAVMASRIRLPRGRSSFLLCGRVFAAATGATCRRRVCISHVPLKREKKNPHAAPRDPTASPAPSRPPRPRSALTCRRTCSLGFPCRRFRFPVADLPRHGFSCQGESAVLPGCLKAGEMGQSGRNERQQGSGHEKRGLEASRRISWIRTRVVLSSFCLSGSSLRRSWKRRCCAPCSPWCWWWAWGPCWWAPSPRTPRRRLAASPSTAPWYLPS